MTLLLQSPIRCSDKLGRGLRAASRRARPSDLRRTAWVRLRPSGLRAPVSRRGLAIWSLGPSASLGVEPERGRRLDCARDPELVEWATNTHE